MPARVLALTPVDEPPVVLAALDAGADDYLPITAGAERIVAAVRRLDGSGPAERVPAAIPASDRGTTDGS
jgi:DNA-binding NarL/FixJ family response regulator